MPKEVQSMSGGQTKIIDSGEITSKGAILTVTSTWDSRTECWAATITMLDQVIWTGEVFEKREDALASADDVLVRVFRWILRGYK